MAYEIEYVGTHLWFDVAVNDATGVAEVHCNKYLEHVTLDHGRFEQPIHSLFEVLIAPEAKKSRALVKTSQVLKLMLVCAPLADDVEAVGLITTAGHQFKHPHDIRVAQFAHQRNFANESTGHTLVIAMMVPIFLQQNDISRGFAHGLVHNATVASCIELLVERDSASGYFGAQVREIRRPPAAPEEPDVAVRFAQQLPRAVSAVPADSAAPAEHKQIQRVQQFRADSLRKPRLGQQIQQSGCRAREGGRRWCRDL